MISDNAANYMNLTMPLISLYIFRLHGLQLADIIHPVYQQSKNIVDTHFEIDGYHVDNFPNLKYIREDNLDVVTPDDMTEALIYCGGMPSHHHKSFTFSEGEWS